MVISSPSLYTGSPAGRWTYDVFLSFRGEDTRNNFVDHLYAALDRAGLYTFKDDQNLLRGKPISPELVRAIEESRVALVVFSKHYANSCWCLDELAKIIECKDLMGQRVLPVFYDVGPSDIRRQKGCFLAAFKQHGVHLLSNMDKVKRWREALETATNLSGWDVPRTANGHEAECIKQIVKNILSCKKSRPAEDVIGMESRIQDVKSLLGKGSDDVSIIGILGMGGIGKTTIARAVYHQIFYKFEGSCFVENVRENGSDRRGLISLQEKILSDIMIEKDLKVRDCDDGLCQIRTRLRHKKVLIVLDDVDNMKQIKSLAGSRDWFGPGSRIMVTTRDAHLLSDAQETYVPALLEETEAMKLFSRYAFNQDIPPKAYEKLSSVVVRHTGHLPLALKILGSHFCGRNLDIWQSSFNVLTKIQHVEINVILKQSYDGLNILEKKILLHIACFFQGKQIPRVVKILDSLGFEALSGITVLIKKSLITISNGNIYMHILIQEMGLCIVREYYPHTMVSDPEEIKGAMMSNDRLENVEAIVETKHHNDRGRRMPCCGAEALVCMKKLKLLHVGGRFTLSEPTYFPEDLRWLCWYWYPYQSLRITGDMRKIVSLEMSYASIEQLQIVKKIIFPDLKFINLRYSRLLKRFPDISGVPNLERLNLSHCDSLLEVHESVLLHEKIIHLDLSSCGNLKILPPYIKMKSLQTLHLNHCKVLEIFPEVPRTMGSLLLLNIDGCDMMSTLPLSIRFFAGLRVLSMISFNSIMKPDRKLEQISVNRILTYNNLHIQGITHLSSLRVLDFKNNHLSGDEFPHHNLHIYWPFLEEMDISRNLFTLVPASISRLSHLKHLDLTGCINLKELHELPSLIQVLRAENCTSLEKIGDLSTKYKWLFKISLFRCPKLLMDQESRGHVANLLMISFVQKCAVVNHRLSIAVPGSKIPNWFSNQQLGNTVKLNLPKPQITKMLGLAVCYLFRASLTETFTYLEMEFRLSGEKENLNYRPAHAAKSANRVWTGYIPIDLLLNLSSGFDTEDLIISCDSDDDIMECGVCVIYKDDIQGMTGTGSLIPDYDELKGIDRDSASREDLQHGRWFKPKFSLNAEKTEGPKTVIVWV